MTTKTVTNAAPIEASVQLKPPPAAVDTAAELDTPVCTAETVGSGAPLADRPIGRAWAAETISASAAAATTKSRIVRVTVAMLHSSFRWPTFML